MERPPRLSVVIPLAPGEDAWRALLPDLKPLTGDTEIVLAHAGDAPGRPPAPWPRALPVRRVRCEPGRARQLNLGARAAQGAWLWFLHADTRLDRQALKALADFLDREPIALGFFDLAFAADGPALTRLNALGANLRSRLLGLPFGDQGFVLSRECYLRLGGFDESLTHGEDHDLIWRARAKGLALRHIPATLVTSGRRYAESGWVATTGRHLLRTGTQALTGWRATRARGRRR